MQGLAHPFSTICGPAPLTFFARIHNPMRVARPKLLIVLAPIGCGFLVVCAALLSGPGFYSRWHSLKDGMSQAEVRQLLGTPTWTGNGECTGAGGKPVTRWEYRTKPPWRAVYYRVDFDYIGPRGAPVVFRTERFLPEWDCPSWCPSWLRAESRG
jgi:hypothetical protein